MLKQRAENLSQLSEKLEEKHSQIIGLENRVQRMENVSPRKSKDVSSRQCRIRGCGMTWLEVFLGAWVCAQCYTILLFPLDISCDLLSSNRLA